MHHNQTDSTHSTFKIPMLPQPQPSQSETLLFNDIMEEKTQALRNTLNEFLRVQPYRRFNAEFNDFLKRTQRIIQEGQRSGANVSRLTNSSQIAPLYSRPSASFNYRPLTPMSMTSSSNSNRTNTFRVPQNSFRPIEPVNPFKPPENMNYEPRVVLPRIEQSMYGTRISPTYATVIEVNQVENESARTKYVQADVHVNYQSPKPDERPQSAAHNSYSDVTIIENRSASSSQKNPEHNENSDDDNAIESLLEEVGFKILVGLPDQSDKSQNTKKNNASQLKNQENVKENFEKHLSTWSVNMKIIKSQMKHSKVVILLTGTLLEKDRLTVIEKKHEAGVLESRKENNLVKTNKGLYRLVGNIIGGHPNELYQTCLTLKGIPRTWRNFMKTFSGVGKTSKNALLNFSLDSPAGPGPIKSKKNTQLDMSMTRRGTTYGKYTNFANQKTSAKRKIPENDVPENSKNKQRKYHEPLSPLLASTPKRPRKQATMFETPSEILKNKIHQKLCNKTSAKQDSRSLNTVNDSIHVAKKRQSISREQTSVFLKPKEPLKTSLNSSNNSKRYRKSADNSSIRSKNNSISKNLSNQTSISKNQSKQISINKNQSKQTSKNSSSILNCSLSIKSKTKPSEKSSENLNNSKQNCKLISSLNSTESSLKKSKRNTSKLDKPTKIAVKKNELPKLVKNNELSSRITSNIVDTKNVKVEKNKTKNCSHISNNTNVSMNKSLKPKKKQCSSSAVLDLFDDMDDTAYDDDVNDYIMSSPSKLSVKSRTDKSRSETPPLFNHHWSGTAKSLVLSEPPTPLSKSVEAKILKRVKAPKLTLQEEIRNNKVENKKQAADYKTVAKKINKMLEFGEQYEDDD